MMPEIALNILDIAENSVRAEASLIEITVSAQLQEDTLTVVIADNGCGMTREEKESVLDPFYTTRTTRKVGLGVPFFKQAAESTGGSFRIDSEKGKGTAVTAVFGLSHIDRMPEGISFSEPEVSAFIKEYLEENKRETDGGADFI